jgi:TPR repeat protein
MTQAPHLKQYLQRAVMTAGLALMMLGCVASDPGLRAALAQADARPEQGRTALRPYAENGDRHAIERICVAYGKSIDSQVRELEREQAFAWCQQAASAGNIEAQFFLGRFHQWGIGVAVVQPAAHRWHTEAARRGHAQSDDARRGLEGKSALCRNWVTGCRLI